jgi:hypothetical protein
VLTVGGSGAAACSSHNVRGQALEVRPDALTEDSAIVGTGPVTVGGIKFTARNSGLRSHWPPVIVRVTVGARNTGSQPATIRTLTGNCAVRLRIFPARRKDERHASPVFDAASHNVECYVPVRKITLAAGDSTSFQSPGDGPGITLSPGRYDLAGVVTLVPSEDSLHRHGPTLIEIPAGTIRVPEPFE